MKVNLPSLESLKNAYEQTQPFVHKTPILTSSILNKKVQAAIFFKCENFQKTGSFKIRGATHAILQLSEKQKSKGVITHSSGNFGQAVALAAKNIGIKAHIVMPNDTSKVKIEAVKNYDGLVTLSSPNLKSRIASMQEIKLKTGATFLHPSNNLDVILGQATSTIELLKQEPKIDFVFAPVGGGGLLAGTALATHYFGDTVEVMGAEPKQVNDAFRSLKSGKIQTNPSANTIAEGLKTNLGNINFPIIKELVHQIYCVEENEIIDAMKFIWQYLKIIVEPSSAVPLAALIKNKEKFKNKAVAIILSGGNVDITKLPF